MSFSGFMDFLRQTNALALAVGVIIGAAMGTVVSSLVNDIIMPPIGLALGGIDFKNMKWVLQANPDPTKEVAIRYGTFVNAVVAFIVIALAVYLISQLFLRPAPAAPTKTCPFCRETIPAAATKCRSCTSAV